MSGVAAEEEPKAQAPAPAATVPAAEKAEEGEEPPQLFQIGDTVRRWVIKSRIGGGAFGETYVGVDTAPESRGQEVCIKAEKQDKRPILRTEVLALKRAQESPNVVRYISSGKHGTVNFLVMEKLGDNLADVRRRCSRGIMDLYSALQYTIACLDCIEQVHSSGLIHRDIKPSNFVLGAPGSPPYTVFVIDFGLAKRYVSSTGEIKPPRENAGFRGTSRYASIASHQQKDLGRVDDLWSLLFMAVEFITGTLPWRRVKEKDAIGQLKQQHVNPGLVRYLPREMTDFVIHLQSLDYSGQPDYAYLRQLLLTTISRKQLVPPAALQAAEASTRSGSQPAPAPAAAITPQEQAVAAPAASTGMESAQSPPRHGDEQSPAQRQRKPIIVDSNSADRSGGGNVILHVTANAPEGRRGLPPMHATTATTDGPQQPFRGPIASPAPDEPASPINLEMGTSLLRSGAATPAVSAVGGGADDEQMLPRAAADANQEPGPGPRDGDDDDESPQADRVTPVSTARPAADTESPAGAFAEREPRKISVASASAGDNNFDAIADARPVPVHEFSDARGGDDDDDDAEPGEAAANSQRPTAKSAKKRRKDRNKKDDDPACGCCIVA